MEALGHGLAYALYWPEEISVIIHFVPGYGFCPVGSYYKVVSKSCLCPYARLSIYSRCVSIREHLPCFVRQTLSLAWCLSSRLGPVASEPWGLPGVHLPTAGVINTARLLPHTVDSKG